MGKWAKVVSARGSIVHLSVLAQIDLIKQAKLEDKYDDELCDLTASHEHWIDD